MVANHIQKKYEVFTNCREHRNPRRGELFRRFETAEGTTSADMIPGKRQICCVGPVDESSILFRTVDGRYYFALEDGWGVKGDTLYGLELGMHFDFGHPTKREDLAEECNRVVENCHPNSWAAAMRCHSLKGIIGTILEVEEREAAHGRA